MMEKALPDDWWTQPNRIVIVAPHVDDEMIGCHDLITRIEPEGPCSLRIVHMFADPDDPVREREANNVAARYVAERLSITAKDKLVHLREAVRDATLVLAPSRFDTHPEHKITNSLVKMIKAEMSKEESKPTFLWYSVDMNIPGKRASVSSEDKAAELRLCYPSQSDYFDANSQCSVFEDIRRHDTVLTVNVERDDVDGYRTSWSASIVGEPNSKVHARLRDAIVGNLLDDTYWLQTDDMTSLVARLNIAGFDDAFDLTIKYPTHTIRLP